VKKTLMLLFRDSETAAFFPKKQLFGSSQEGVSEIQFKRAPVGISV
jgi:hypothetical protein